MPLQYTTLGHTGLKVSRLCLGTMNFGSETSEGDSYAIMDRALELGINFFDTANFYGIPKGNGITEEIVGRWLAQGGGRREKIVLATKLYATMGPGPNDRGLSAYHIRNESRESLRRLQTDYIDLYQMHHIDRGVRSKGELRNTGVDEFELHKGPAGRFSPPWEEIWQAMEQLVREGKVLYTGSCNFAAWNITQANGVAKQRNFLGLVSEQSVYNLNNRMVELEVIPACRALGVGFIPWSPLGAGLLAGVLERRHAGRRAAVNIEKYRQQLEEYEALCRDIGEEPAVVALAWLFHNPVVTALIIGPRTVEQLESSISAIDLRLPDDVLDRLDRIWPGPGGEAPEAYSW